MMVSTLIGGALLLQAAEEAKQKAIPKDMKVFLEAVAKRCRPRLSAPT
jgi:hypothetical protein